MVQMLSDPAPLLGRAIAYERLVGSQLIQEDEPLPSYDQNDLPPPPPPPSLRAHPKAPYLRLVVSQDSPAFLQFRLGRSAPDRWSMSLAAGAPPTAKITAASV